MPEASSSSSRNPLSAASSISNSFCCKSPLSVWNSGQAERKRLKMMDSKKLLDFGFAFNDEYFSDRVLHLPKQNASVSHAIKENCSVGVKSKSLHISSAVLAVKSPFFQKLFKNDMTESPQKDVTLRMDSIEELTALMDVLSFIYKNTLSATTCSDLLAALLDLPLSLDFAILHIDLPPSLLVSEIVQPLVEGSKKALAVGYMDFSKSQEKAMELPHSALKVVLGSDGLRVNSEDDVYELMLNWARARYPDLKERREMLTNSLLPLIRFPYMSCLQLEEVLACPDFDHEQASKLVLEAFISKVEVPYGQHLHASKDYAISTGRGRGRGRAYIRWLVKVVQLDFPQPRCVVYLNLRKDECADLFPSKQLYSQTFSIGRHSLFLMARCKKNERHVFGLFVGQSEGSETCKLDFKLAVMNKSSNDFETKLTVKNHTFEGEDWGALDLLRISWTDFVSDDSEYFINDILRLRVKITLNN
ncbi:hypothetical protein V2J09_008735 [Rumex salicifolius]